MSKSSSIADLQIGHLYWIPDTEQGWIRARIHQITDHDLHLKVGADDTSLTLPIDQYRSLIPAGADCGDLADVQDLTQLDRISIASLLATLRARFFTDRVYTYAGLTLVSVNPFKSIPEQYGATSMASFIKGGDNMPPHIYAVAQRCRQNLIETHQPQSLIICGDSGAGKTEAAKYALQYLVLLSAHCTESDQIREATNEIQTRIIQCNPVLEAFGNAETVRNENSSRFGKYLEISVEKQTGVIRLASMTYFMLETSRITGHANGERCFHAFYAIVVGLDPQLLQDQFGLQSTKSTYKILQPANGSSGKPSPHRRRPSIPSLKVASAAEEWAGIVSSMRQIGVTDDEIHAISSVLAAILHVGNIRFETDDQNHARVIEDHHFDWFIRLTSFDRKRCLEAFTCRYLGQNPQHVVQVPIDVQAAESGRNALAKEMYGRLFRWIVARINVSLQNIAPVQSDTLTTIGILDVFGFEKFDDRNGFEQICINYCNERLQAMFIESVLSVTEQQAYSVEGIQWNAILLPDCTPTLTLIETILKLLDDECLIPQGSASHLFTTISQISSSVFTDDNRRSPLHFTISHYAGQVQYDSSEFITKNRDRISDDMNDLLDTATSLLIYAMTSSTTPFSMSTEMQVDDPVSARRSTTKKSRFQAGQFRGQVQHLMSTLGRTTPHFIRCIKPNQAQRPGLFQFGAVLDQLGNAGVLELVRVRQTGFPIRLSHEQFRIRYQFNDIVEPLEVFLLRQLKENLFAVGNTLVFLKDDGYSRLEAIRNQALTVSVISLQALLQVIRARIRFRRWRSSLAAIQSAIATYAGVRSHVSKNIIAAAMLTLVANRAARSLLRSWSQKAKDVDLNKIDGIDALYVTSQVVMLTFTTSDVTSAMLRLICQLRDGAPFRIYNLCLDIEYDKSALLPGELAHFPSSGHTPCPFAMLCEFCLSISEWISKPDSIAIVHSKGGRGRCSLMIGAYLLHQRISVSQADAMSRVASLCSDQDPDRHLAPSQRRYLEYYHRYVIASPPTQLNVTVNLTHATLDNVDSSYMGPDMEIWLMIATQQDDGKMRQKWIRSVSRTATSCSWKLRKPCLLSGDVKIEVLSREKRGKVAKVLMYVCTHSAFVQPRSVFTKTELDKVYRDADKFQFVRFSIDFET